MKKNLIIYLVLIVFSLVLYLLSIRGSWIVPSPYQIEYTLNNSGQAFETSQERSRYAIILSMINDKTFSIDNYASMGTPDVGKINGHYYSLFPPTASIIATPLYLLGLKFGAPQIFTFATSMLFSLLTMLLIVKFTRQLKLHWSIGLFSAIGFGFATNAWGYSVTLYAHLISAFLVLAGLYLTVFLQEKWKLLQIILVWLIYGLAVYVDYPNIFTFFPIAILLTAKGFIVQESEESFTIKFDWRFIVGPIIFFGLICLYGYYNFVNFGSFTRLSNALPRVQDLKDALRANPQKGTVPTNVLQTRSLLEGLQTFLVSYDRGILIYSPIALFFIFGLGQLRKISNSLLIILVAVPATSLVLYSLFPDPYGGWAFGSRYMVSILPILLIIAGVGLQRFYKNILVKLFYSLVFIYSAGISTLSPITTNVIPPFVEARNIGLDSWFIINWRMLMKNELNSFFYNTVLHAQISGLTYYLILLSIICFAGILLIWIPKNNRNESKI